MNKLIAIIFLLSVFAAARAEGNTDLVDKWTSWASSARHDLDLAGGPPDSDIFKWCLKAYDDAIKGGVAPSTPVEVRGEKSTLEEYNTKVCKAGMAKLTVEASKRWAQYKKVLKHDKLAMVMKDLDAIALPGGNGSDDPAKLAASSVWFIDTSPSETCANGAQKHVLHRYQFDGGQRIAKTSDKAYCGAPSRGAYR
ncbi:MAG: hypothetical protein ABIY55_27455 [Kofleriaceae bacterium]